LLRQVIPTLLDDEAAMWYQCHNDYNSYMQFKNEFMKYYSSPAYMEQLQDQFASRSQHKDEPITHYTLVIRNFYKNLNITANDNTIINRIISKVCHKYVKYFCDKTFKDLAQFEDYVLAVNNSVAREKMYVPPPPP
jgi:hypothetical protein